MRITMITGSSSKNKLNNNTKNRMIITKTMSIMIQALIPVATNIAVEMR